MSINNRSTFCDHCSLRADLPGFIGREHAQGNVDKIKNGDIFACHRIYDHHDPDPKACLGAALFSGQELANPVAENLPALHESLDSYVEHQGANRIDGRAFFGADRWTDRHRSIWHGFWAQAKTGKWRYFMTTQEDWANDSVYLFFDQCEDTFGPLEKLR